MSRPCQRSAVRLTMISPSEYDLQVLSLGAGVQSTYLALNASRFGQVDCAIFADTGWEPDAVYDQLGHVADEVDFIVHQVTNGDIREEVLAAVGAEKIEYGQPPFSVINRDQKLRADGGYETADVGGKIWRRCTAYYKIDPIQREIRHLLGYKPRQRIKKRVRQWFGITTDEAQRMKDSRATGSTTGIRSSRRGSRVRIASTGSRRPGCRSLRRARVSAAPTIQTPPGRR
jgi:hypothetical protein